MARPRAPESSSTSASTVGLPRESRTSRPITCSMVLTTISPWVSPLVGHRGTTLAVAHLGLRGRLRLSRMSARNDSARSRSACSASTPSRWARFATAKSTSPTCACRSPPSLDSGSSACGSVALGAPGQRRQRLRRLARRSRRRGSTPTARALRASLVVSISAGRPAGMPSVTLLRPFSLFLIASQFVTTCSALSASTSPNTCGWRWTSLSCTRRATSARSNCPASSARRAWKTIWKSRSPSSSCRCA